MTPRLFLELAIAPALRLLPPAMTSAPARAMVLATALQESSLAHRRQYPTGPARGYCQFEVTGVAGVLTHRASRAHAVALCAALDVEPVVEHVHRAIEFQDVLAAAFARLLLWTHPEPLPSRFEFDRGWRQYERTWRPGKPRPEKWPTSYANAWSTVRDEE